MSVVLVEKLGEALSRVAPIRVLDAAVAFVLRGGPELLETVLAEERRVRILTGLHLGSTDPAALRMLLDMGAEVKVYTRATFHPKVYLVRGASGLREREALAVVGSANLSRAGLVDNVEASIALRGAPDSPVLRAIIAYFERLWNSPDSKPLDDELLRRFERYWRRVSSAASRARAAETLDIARESGNSAWLAVTSPENYEICARRGLWGVERMTRAIKRVKPGDLFIFYVKGEKEVRDVWVAETEAFESRDRVWPDKVYPYRVRIRRIIRGSADMRGLVSELSFIRNVEMWGSHLQREMVKLCLKDAKILISALRPR